MPDVDTAEFGPLPDATAENSLQRESIAALNSVLPPNKLIFRRESEDDEGVDGTIEVWNDGKATNIRSHAQIKARSNASENKDGSVSVSDIEVTNFSYMINSPCPIYILYRPELRELRYAWAWDEMNRFQAEGVAWKTQKTVTIRFLSILTGSEVSKIAERILKEASLHRRLRNIFSSLPDVEDVSVIVQRQDFSLVDSKKSWEILSNAGYNLVASGRYDDLEKLVSVLDAENRRKAKTQLLLAYSAYMRGRYLHALGFLAEVQMALSELSSGDDSFFHFLKSTCEYETGGISSEEYVKLQNNWANSAPKVLRLQYQLQSLRFQLLLHGVSESERQNVVSAAKAISIEAASLPAQYSSVKIKAELISLELEGIENVNDLTASALMYSGRREIGIDLGRQERVLRARQMMLSWSRWLASLHAIVEQCRKLGSLSLLCDALLTKSMITISMINQQRFLNFLLELDSQVDASIFAILSNDLEEVVLTSTKSDLLEYRLRAKVMQAECYHMTGQEADSIKTAAEVLPIAKSLHLNRIVEDAMLLVQGKSHADNTLDELRHTKEMSIDEMAVAVDESQLSNMADFAIKISGIPSSRKPIVLKELRAIRFAAAQKLGFCAHLEMMQDLRHTASRSTMYAIDPARVCVCSLHGDRSLLESPDYEAVFNAFKSSRCKDCPERSPGKGGEV